MILTWFLLYLYLGFVLCFGETCVEILLCEVKIFVVC